MVPDDLIAIRGPKHIILVHDNRSFNQTSGVRLRISTQFNHWINMFPEHRLNGNVVARLLIICCVYPSKVVFPGFTAHLVIRLRPTVLCTLQGCRSQIQRLHILFEHRGYLGALSYTHHVLTTLIGRYNVSHSIETNETVRLTEDIINGTNIKCSPFKADEAASGSRHILPGKRNTSHCVVISVAHGLRYISVRSVQTVQLEIKTDRGYYPFILNEANGHNRYRELRGAFCRRKELQNKVAEKRGYEGLLNEAIGLIGRKRKPI